MRQSLHSICRSVLKRFNVPLLLVFLFIVVHVDTDRQKTALQEGTWPLPAEVTRLIDSDEDYKKGREDWIELMHSASPGVNWREMDEETREKKNQVKLGKRESLLSEGLLKTGRKLVETLANGLIEGTWVERGSNNLAGRMHTADVDFDNDLIYGASAGGNIWVGHFDGTGWTSINDYLQIQDILFIRLFSDGIKKRLVVVQETGPGLVYYTDNDGLNWMTANGFESFTGSERLLRAIYIDETNPMIYLLCSEYLNGILKNSIYKSTDLGTNFNRMITINEASSGHDKCDMWAPNKGSGVIYILDDHTLYSLDTDDNLNMISNITTTLGDISMIRLTGNLGEQATHLYALFYANGESHIYQSSNHGVSWAEMGKIPDSPFGKNSFACSIQDPFSLYMGGIDCFRSEDGGRNWSMVNRWEQYYGDPEHLLHADIPGINIFIDDQGKEFALLSTDGGIYYSDDQLLSVQNLSLNGLRISQYYSTYTYPGKETLYAGSQDQGFQIVKQDPGHILDFEQTISGDYGHIVSGDGGCSIWTVHPDFVLYYPMAYITNWYTYGYIWTFEGMNYLWMPPLMEDPEAANKVYLGGGGTSPGAYIWHLTAGSNLIASEEQPFDFSRGNSQSNISAMAYSPLDFDYRYTLTSDGQFYYSNDGGLTWSPNMDFQAPAGHYFYGSSIIASPNVLGRLYIAGSGYSNPAVYVSEDHGNSFVPLGLGLPNTLVYDIAITPDENLLFAATEVGPYVYVKQDGIWYDLAGVTGPDQIYWSVEYLPASNILRFGTYGRGIWDFVIDSGSDVPDDEKVAVIPKGCSLFQNYPNPFNESTKIRFSLREASFITLKIYNYLGKEIENLVSEKRQTGDHEVTWNTKEFPSGIYVCRLQAGDYVETRKLVLQK